MGKTVNLRSKSVNLTLPCLITVFFDQITKLIAGTHLAGREPIVFLRGFFVFIYVQNKGAFLSLGGNLGDVVRLIFLTVIPLAILIAAGMYLFKTDKVSLRQICYFSLILGGGLSNIFDRLFRGGQVVDFMNIGIRNFRTGIFNVADLGIIFGGGLILLSFLRESGQEKNEDKVKNG